MQVIIGFEKKPLSFYGPQKIITCRRLSDVHGCLAQMEAALSSGGCLAGFFSYEAGYAFEECFNEDRDFDFPLVHFGVYPHPLTPSPSLMEKGNSGGNSMVPPLYKMERGTGGEVRTNIPYPDYSNNINSIKSYIASGDTYQITYCIKYRFNFTGDPFAYYRQLLKEQPVPYPAFIKTDDFSILSLSPEMFLKKRAGNIKVKPMKGTWPRGNNLWSDLWAKRRLHLDPKNRAENVMIADLLRNDLGRISRAGTVVTPKLFEVARYTTLCQMTSTVSGTIDPGIKIHDLFKAVFPSGSVTGAPKIRSMRIIKELENEDRRIYTGAIGYITPQRDMFFNVPIRTLLIRGDRGEMGVGGGIVWDSTPQGEWDECELKARFLTNWRSSLSPRSFP